MGTLGSSASIKMFLGVTEVSKASLGAIEIYSITPTPQVGFPYNFPLTLD